MEKKECEVNRSNGAFANEFDDAEIFDGSGRCPWQRLTSDQKLAWDG